MDSSEELDVSVIWNALLAETELDTGLAHDGDEEAGSGGNVGDEPDDTDDAHD